MVLFEDFMIKRKIQNHFFTGCPKSALREGKTKFWDFFLQQKFGKGHEALHMGRLNISLSKGKKMQNGGGAYSPSPMSKRLKYL